MAILANYHAEVPRFMYILWFSNWWVGLVGGVCGRKIGAYSILYFLKILENFQLTVLKNFLASCKRLSRLTWWVFWKTPTWALTLSTLSESPSCQKISSWLVVSVENVPKWKCLSLNLKIGPFQGHHKNLLMIKSKPSHHPFNQNAIKSN